MRASLYSLLGGDNHNLASYERRMLAVIVILAVAMLVLAVRAERVVRSGRVLLLVDRAFSMKPFVACLVCFLASVLAAWRLAGLFETTGQLVTFIVAFGVGVVSMLIVVFSEVTRRMALGEITLVDAKTLRIELRGQKAVIVDNVAVAKTTTPEYARFDVNDSLRFVGVVPHDMWASIAGEPQPLTGTTIAGSSRTLLEWARA